MHKHHASLLWGYLSLGSGILAGIIVTCLYIFLRLLPPATYLFEKVLHLSFIPLGLALLGLFAYWRQSRYFVVNEAKAALITNILSLVLSVYLMTVLSSAV